MHFKNLYTLIIIITGVALYSGCSSTSSSARYTPKKETKEPKDESVRFTSNDGNFSSDTAGVEYIDEYGDPDEVPSDEASVDISSVLQKYGTSKSSSDINANYSTGKEKILMEIIKYLNTPYKFGGNSKNGIDCSAFTQTIYMNTIQIPLLRTTREQYTQGFTINSKEELEFGDLVFFNTRRRVRPGHVGIYIGEGLFAHASSKKGVIVSSLSHEYYNRTYMGGRRIDGIAEAINNPPQ